VRAWVTAVVFFVVTVSGVARAFAQDSFSGAADTPVSDSAQAASSSASPSMAPINPSLRVRWLLDGAIGPKSLLLVGPLSAGWQTAWNQPEEWGHSWSGFGKRYLAREADVAIANTIEAGLGAIWGEDPRFVPSRRQGIWPRAGFAIKTTFVAPRRDGKLRPAWGRYAGKIGKNFIENEWLPPSAHTTRQMLLRAAQGFTGRMLGNLWDEFWPDVLRRLRR
jgi:hypothetical protein